MQYSQIVFLLFYCDDVLLCSSHRHGHPSGICYFLRDESHNGLVKYTYHLANDQSFTKTRSLSDGKTDIVIRDIRRESFIVKASVGKSFGDIVSARKPFGINTDISNNKSGYLEYSLSEEPSLILYWFGVFME